jgi:4-hydroxy-2-oxoheptanedioate aldolase
MLDSSRNAVKEAAAKRTKVRGVHLSFPAPQIIEVLGPTGLDFVYFDGEHGAFDTHDLAEHCRTAELVGLTPIARLPNTATDTITQYLDRGVRGLILPHIETVAQAKAIVGAAYYAPLGSRSYGAGRPEFGIGEKFPTPAYWAMCNGRTSVSLMIESEAGLEAAPELAAVEGVDYLSFGLFDLSQALGFPGQPSHPEVQRRVAETSEKIRAAGKPIREDFIKFAWINDVLKAGSAALL